MGLINIPHRDSIVTMDTIHFQEKSQPRRSRATGSSKVWGKQGFVTIYFPDNHEIQCEEKSLQALCLQGYQYRCKAPLHCFLN